MAKKWFGPVLCPAGCCYEPPPPPPPPPCACEDAGCLEPYTINYSSFALEVDIDDGFTSFAQVKELKCGTTCRNVYQVTEVERVVSGLSAFNGTYEIPFYAYDDYLAAWVEADPTAVSCGVWFYPTVSAYVTAVRTTRQYALPTDVYALYSSTGCVESESVLTETLLMHMETRSGLIWTNDVIDLGNVFLGPATGTPGLALSPVVQQHLQTASVFPCSAGAGPAVSESNDVDGTYPTYHSPLRHSPPFPVSRSGGSSIALGRGQIGNLLAWNRAVGVKYLDVPSPYVTEPRQSSGYDWSVYPYGGPGIPVSSTQCTLDLEEYEDQFFATSTFIDDLRGTNPLQRCNPFGPFFSPAFVPGPYRPIVWQFANSAFRQHFRSIVNA